MALASPVALEAVGVAGAIDDPIADVVDVSMPVWIAASETFVAIVVGKPVDALRRQPDILEFGVSEFPARCLRERDALSEVFLAPGGELFPGGRKQCHRIRVSAQRSNHFRQLRGAPQGFVALTLGSVGPPSRLFVAACLCPNPFVEHSVPAPLPRSSVRDRGVALRWRGDGLANGGLAGVGVPMPAFGEYLAPVNCGREVTLRTQRLGGTAPQ